jgi:signal peptidase complex subunit 2
MQAFEDQGFPEDHRLSNIKLALGTIACLLALVAQFYPNPFKPLPFPESRPLLLVCCVSYFAISFGLQAITSLFEKDAILFTLPPMPSSPFYETMKGHRVRVSTTLPRFSVRFLVYQRVRKYGA